MQDIGLTHTFSNTLRTAIPKLRLFDLRVHGLKAKVLLQTTALVTEDIKGELAMVCSHSAVAHSSKWQSAH